MFSVLSHALTALSHALMALTVLLQIATVAPDDPVSPLPACAWGSSPGERHEAVLLHLAFVGVVCITLLRFWVEGCSLICF